jgi:hypothetical protein
VPGTCYYTNYFGELQSHGFLSNEDTIMKAPDENNTGNQHKNPTISHYGANQAYQFLYRTVPAEIITWFYRFTTLTRRFLTNSGLFLHWRNFTEKKSISSRHLFSNKRHFPRHAVSDPFSGLRKICVNVKGRPRGTEELLVLIKKVHLSLLQ